MRATTAERTARASRAAAPGAQAAKTAQVSTPDATAPASEAMAPSEEPLYVVPEEGDVDPADVIRATFAQTSGALPGAMPERRPEAQAMLFGAEEVAATLPGAALPDADDWAEGEGYEEGYEDEEALSRARKLASMALLEED